jgi:hypothetical protein
MASLTWKVKKIEDSCGNSNPSWISVSPSTGTSSVNPNITVSEATSPDDCSDGYVVLSASTGDETIIPVSRCLPDCNCTKVAFASTIDGTEYGENYEGTVTAGTYNTSACGTIGVIVGGTIFDRSSISVSNGKITIKVTANTSYDKRYDFFRFTLNGKTCFSGSISQAAKVNPCYTSTTVSVTPNTITDETCAGTSATYTLTGTGNECWFVKKAKITPNDLAIINLDSSEITVTPNPSYEPRVGTCMLTIQNGTNGIEVQSTINIIQTACESPASCSDVVWIGDDECIICNCSADDFELSTTSIEVPIDGYDDVIGTVSTCIDKVNMEVAESSSTPWGVELSYIDENIYLTVPENSDEERSETITITYSATCGNETWEKTVSLSQEGAEPAGCTCNSFRFLGEDEDNDTYKYTLTATGGEYVTVATAADGCQVIDYASGEESGDFNAIVNSTCGGGYSFTGSEIKIRPTMNVGAAREGTLTVTYKVRNLEDSSITDTCAKTIHLVQSAGSGQQTLSVYLTVTGNMYNNRKSDILTLKVNNISVDFRYTMQQGTFENVYAAVAGMDDISSILCGTISETGVYLTDSSSSAIYTGRLGTGSATKLYSMANIVINITQA